jgi:glycosyltransferase involved in cell wall biosynthesis
MKILFVIPSLAKGGQEKAGMLLCNFLTRYHEVIVVCFEEKNIADFDYQCEVIRIKIGTGNNFFKKALRGVKRIRSLKKLKKKIAPDVSIAFGNTAIILNSLTGSKEKKIASIRQSFSGFINDNSFTIKIHKALYRRALQRSQRIVPVNKEINKELKLYYGIQNDTFINNGYDIEKIKEMSREEVLLFNQSKLWIIHSGRFDLSKGHWHLIKIFTELKKEFPKATLLLLGATDSSGEGASIFDFCKAYLKENNLSWSDKEFQMVDVIFLGHQMNPFKFISKSDLFIFPSIWEGFPNALVEAMACGLPVVATDCKTGPRDILIDKKTGEEFGLLLPEFNDKFDPQMTRPNKADLYFAEQVKNLLKNEGKLKHFRSQSIKRASFFSISEMWKKWLKVIEGK